MSQFDFAAFLRTQQQQAYAAQKNAAFQSAADQGVSVGIQPGRKGVARSSTSMGSPVTPTIGAPGGSPFATSMLPGGSSQGPRAWNPSMGNGATRPAASTPGPAPAPGKTFGEQTLNALQTDATNLQAAQGRAQDRTNQVMGGVQGQVDRLNGQVDPNKDTAFQQFVEPVNKAAQENVDMTSKRVAETEAGFTDTTNMAADARDQASASEQEDMKRMIEADVQSKNITPQEGQKRLTELDVKFGADRRGAVASDRAAFNTAMAQLKTTGTQLMQQAAGGKIAASQFVSQMAGQSRQFAEQMIAQGRTHLGQLVSDYPDSPISILSMLFTAGQVQQSGVGQMPAVGSNFGANRTFA